MEILAFIFSILVAMFLLKIVFKVSISLISIFVNSLVGAIVLYILNIFGLGIPINLFTSILVGVFGLPGVIIVLALKFIFKVF